MVGGVMNGMKDNQSVWYVAGDEEEDWHISDDE